MVKQTKATMVLALGSLISLSSPVVGQGTGTQAQAGQGAPASGSPVQIFLTVTSKSDSPPVPTISQLSASVDKQPAGLTSLHFAGDEKLLFAVLVDIRGANPPVAEQTKKAARMLFQELLKEGNEGFLVAFNSKTATTEKIDKVSDVQAKLDDVSFRGWTALFDAIVETCSKTLSRNSNQEFSRRVIFVISDGEDHASSASPEKASEVAAVQGIVIFSLATEVSQRLSDPYAASKWTGAGPPPGVRNLREISQTTGGEAVYDKELEDGVVSLLNAIRRQWALVLRPVQPPDQKLHSLIIKTSQKDLLLSVPAHVFVQ
jgi:hypothetical protein